MTYLIFWKISQCFLCAFHFLFNHYLLIQSQADKKAPVHLWKDHIDSWFADSNPLVGKWVHDCEGKVHLEFSRKYPNSSIIDNKGDNFKSYSTEFDINRYCNDIYNYSVELTQHEWFWPIVAFTAVTVIVVAVVILSQQPPGPDSNANFKDSCDSPPAISPDPPYCKGLDDSQPIVPEAKGLPKLTSETQENIMDCFFGPDYSSYEYVIKCILPPEAHSQGFSGSIRVPDLNIHVSCRNYYKGLEFCIEKLNDIPVRIFGCPENGWIEVNGERLIDLTLSNIEQMAIGLDPDIIAAAAGPVLDLIIKIGFF